MKTRKLNFWDGSIFGLIIGLLISQFIIWATIGKAVYDAKVEQYKVDRETFYGDRLGDWRVQPKIC